MTNAEKFKEDFGYYIDDDLCIGAVNCRECPCGKYRAEYGMSCSNKFWHSEYTGAPTIPLSVIEKIHTEVGNLEWYGDDAFWDGVNAVTSIIDKAVKECTHDKG